MVTNDTSALVAHIRARNAKTEAWVAEDPANRWAGLLVDDPAHWAAYGITTPEQFDHYLLVCDVYEGTRSVFGYKPSWAAINAMTTAELEAESATLSRMAREDAEREAREEREHAAAVAAAMTPKAFTLGDLFPALG